MLRELRITNLALISELYIEFADGLLVLTGETGAGKSIILQSINLLYGEKAARSWVRSGAESAVVEALFECPEGSPVMDMLKDHEGGTADGTVILKRVISAKGSSRYYLNGSMATGKFVSEFTENLIAVASQHDHQQLLSPSMQLDFIDAFGGLMSDREDLAERYDRWSSLKGKYSQLQQAEHDKEQRRDFLAFQCSEINDAKIMPDEDSGLHQEKDRLRAVEDLTVLGAGIYEMLQGRVSDSLAEVCNDLARMAAYDSSLEKLSEDVSGYSYQVEEAGHQLRDYLDNIVDDPERLEEVTSRIDLLQKLKRKYGDTLEGVIEFGRRAEEELQQLADMDRTLSAISIELEELTAELVECGNSLSAKRRQVAGDLSAAVSEELNFLCLENATFEISIPDNDDKTPESMTRRGWDRPDFLFSANPGEPLMAMARVASGGELSRLMLALKCILAVHDKVDTVVFDEIDAGISGKAAEAVARKIKELSVHHQVICITHLPQIASFAREHFTVTKNVNEERTHTDIARLSDNMRIEELSRMLDGESVTPKTRAYVTELIERNR